MYGTTYGFSLTRRRKEPSTGGGGGGTGEQLRFARDLFTQTAAFVANSLTIPLTQTPVDLDGLQVWSQGLVLHPDDYTVLTGPYRVRINFSADPATDTDTGEWKFVISYPYVL
jgi:hypothetical protein